MNRREERAFLNHNNAGLVLDGAGQKRLSLQDSFQNVGIVSPVGGGKSTRYIIPKLCRLNDCSIVVTDPSGELYHKTAGCLASRGFRIKVFNLADPQRSLCYNPLVRANSYTEIDELCSILMQSAHEQTKPEDRIWIDEPQTLLSVLITCLKSSGEPEWQNLHNLLYLLQHFGTDGKPIRRFVENHAPSDGNRTLNQFLAFAQGHEKMLSSFLTMARNAFKLINNPEIAQLTARDEFDFDSLKAEKTALFVIVPEANSQHYRFLINLFYAQLFKAMKQERYLHEGLPVHFLLDEFGQFKIPDFPSVATTIRKYQVSLSLILQDYGQLEAQYGREQAQTIFSGGIRTKLIYSGVDVSTSKMLEEMLGKVVVEQKSNGTKHRREENLMNADRIRRIEADQALCVSANREPLLFQTSSSYENPLLRELTSMPPPSFPHPIPGMPLHYVPL